MTEKSGASETKSETTFAVFGKALTSVGLLLLGANFMWAGAQEAGPIDGTLVIALGLFIAGTALIMFWAPAIKQDVLDEIAKKN